MGRGYSRIDPSHNRFERHEGKKPMLYCKYCHKLGHSIEKCYKLHGFPPNHKFRGGRRMVAFAQADYQENDHHVSISHNPQTAVPGFTPEQSHNSWPYFRLFGWVRQLTTLTLQLKDLITTLVLQPSPVLQVYIHLILDTVCACYHLCLIRKIHGLWTLELVTICVTTRTWLLVWKSLLGLIQSICPMKPSWQLHMLA